MSLKAINIQCSQCGASLGGKRKDQYTCGFCGVISTNDNLNQPERKQLNDSVEKLYKAVICDLDNDGWAEICGWVYEKGLLAVDPIDSNVLWKVFEDKKEEFHLFTGPGRIYAVSEDARLIALNSYTGQQEWIVHLSDTASAIFDGGYGPNAHIYALTYDDHLFTIDRATGAIKEKQSAGGSSSDFFKIDGQRFIWGENHGFRILDTGSTTPVLKKVELMPDMEFISNLTQKDSYQLKYITRLSIDVYKGILYVIYEFTSGGQSKLFMDGYRLDNGELIARKIFTTDYYEKYIEPEFKTIVRGQFLFTTDEEIRLEPQGTSRALPLIEGYEVKEIHNVNDILILALEKNRAGKNLWSLCGLDSQTLDTLWQLDDIGYYYGQDETPYNEDMYVYQIGHDDHRTLFAIDPGSGALLWQTDLPEYGTYPLDLKSGIILDRNTSVAVFSETGDKIFPLKHRSKSFTKPQEKAHARTMIPVELPDWGEIELEKTVIPDFGTLNRAFVIIITLILSGVIGFFLWEIIEAFYTN